MWMDDIDDDDDAMDGWLDDIDVIDDGESSSSSSHSDEEIYDSDSENEEEDDDSDSEDESNPRSLLVIAGKKLLQLWTDDSDREYSRELWIDGEDDCSFNASCFPSDEEIYTVMTLGKSLTSTAKFL